MDVPQNSIIPSEIYYSNIFPYLDTKSSIKCEEVCQCWNKLMNQSEEKVNVKTQLFHSEMGFYNYLDNKPNYLCSQLSGLVGGWKRFKQLPKIKNLTSSGHLAENLVERQIAEPFLQLKDMKDSLMTGIDHSGYLFVAAIVNEEYKKQSHYNRQSLLVLFELKEQLFCHYTGRLTLSSSMKLSDYKTNISQEQKQKIIDLLNGNTIESRTSCGTYVNYQGTATVAKEGFKLGINF